MTDSRALAVWAQVAAHAAAHGQRPSVADVCAVAVSSAQLSGAWVVAARGGDPDFVMGVTDPISEQLAELQLTLGEGPGLDASASGGAVLASDLGDVEAIRRWPAGLLKSFSAATIVQPKHCGGPRKIVARRVCLRAAGACDSRKKKAPRKLG